MDGLIVIGSKVRKQFSPSPVGLSGQQKGRLGRWNLGKSYSDFFLNHRKCYVQLPQRCTGALIRRIWKGGRSILVFFPYSLLGDCPPDRIYPLMQIEELTNMIKIPGLSPVQLLGVAFQSLYSIFMLLQELQVKEHKSLMNLAKI
jgi:hypothetical protein